MRKAMLAAAVITAVAGVSIVRSARQALPIVALDETALREYAGAYRWGPDAFVYLQIWHEFSGFGKPGHLVAFDESGDVRILYPTERDRFFAGPGAAVPAPVESRIDFQRDAWGTITSLTWRRDAAERQASRAQTETREDVRFASGNLRLAGTLFQPASGNRHPAVILVHGSGPENREYVLPFARFLVRRGMAVLGYDKRGVGGSTGDWSTASFEDLAGDVVSAFDYLKTRRDIDPGRIGLLGISQAGWIMPLAAARANGLAFVISVSGAGVPPAETTLDQAQNEMAGRGMKPQTVADIVGIMKLQYHFARTGQGWDEYAAARGKLAARLGRPPDTMPGSPDDPYWQSIRKTYFHDPGPALRQLRVAVLALFGALDNNILAEKNRGAWESALSAGGHRDYTLRILPRANHIQWEARAGTNAEIPTLQRFVPEYFATIREWLGTRIKGIG
jgi:hypothetical protein